MLRQAFYAKQLGILRKINDTEQTEMVGLPVGPDAELPEIAADMVPGYVYGMWVSMQRVDKAVGEEVRKDPYSLLTRQVPPCSANVVFPIGIASAGIPNCARRITSLLIVHAVGAPWVGMGSAGIPNWYFPGLFRLPSSLSRPRPPHHIFAHRACRRRAMGRDGKRWHSKLVRSRTLPAPITSVTSAPAASDLRSS
ncbi:hypothetical protein DFH09DRAFT_1081814 [Mycena vulgaris]|nr:hypothetical protein DFH09DRAFT_1081814 [Mycena vulgaris]